MDLVSDTLAIGSTAMQYTSRFSARAVDDSKAHSDVVKLAIAIIECISIQMQEQVAKPLYATLKVMNDFFSGVKVPGSLYDIITGRALFDNPIRVQVQRQREPTQDEQDAPLAWENQDLPNPLTFTLKSCVAVVDAGSALQFASALDWIDLGKCAESVGSLPFFGSYLKEGVMNLSLVRSTFGMMCSFLDAVDSVRGMIVNGVTTSEISRLAIDILKLSSAILCSYAAVQLKFLGHVANGTASLISLTVFALK